MIRLLIKGLKCARWMKVAKSKEKLFIFKCSWEFLPFFFFIIFLFHFPELLRNFFSKKKNEKKTFFSNSTLLLFLFALLLLAQKHFFLAFGWRLFNEWKRKTAFSFKYVFFSLLSKLFIFFLPEIKAALS